MKYLMALLGLLAAAATIPAYTAFDGYPPYKYQTPITTTVIFAEFKDIPKLCHYAPPPRGQRYEGCTLANGTLVVPNSCSGEFAGQSFARLVCHEQGHFNHWPGWHPDAAGNPQGKEIHP